MSKKHSHYDDPIADDTQSAPAPAEGPPPEERSRELLTALTEAQRHNAPVTMWMLDELRDLLGHFTGKPIPKPLHEIKDSRGQVGHVTLKQADGSTLVIDTIEEALAYLRGLPIEVQKRPHWRAADKLLAEAVTFMYTADVSPAVRAFENAIAQDRSIEPRQIDIPARDASLEPPKPPPAAEPEPTHA